MALVFRDGRGRRRGRNRGRGGRWRIDRDRIVLRHVHDFRLGRAEHDHFLAFLLLGLDLHLRRALQVADVHGLPAQALHGLEHAGLVGDERLAELGGPVELQAHHVDGLRELQQRAHRRREADLGGGLVEGIALERRVLQQPVAGVEHFLGIGCRDQYLRQHWIGVERDRREQPFERLGGPRRWSLRPRSRAWCRVAPRVGRPAWVRARRVPGLGRRLLGATGGEGGDCAEGRAEREGA